MTPQSSVRVTRTATMGGTSVQNGDGLGPSPFAPPPKRQRATKEPEAYCVSEPQTCINFAYCYHEFYDLADPRWDCEICGAHVLLIGTSERCRQKGGALEVCYHEGELVAWRGPGTCDRCGVDWIKRQIKTAEYKVAG